MGGLQPTSHETDAHQHDFAALEIAGIAFWSENSQSFLHQKVQKYDLHTTSWLHLTAPVFVGLRMLCNKLCHAPNI